MQITHNENNYAKITQKLRNVLGNAPFCRITQKLRKLRKNYAKITQVPKNYADYAPPILLMMGRQVSST